MKSASMALEVSPFALIATSAKFRSANGGQTKRHPSRWGLLCILIIAPGGFFVPRAQSEARSVSVPLSQSDGFEIVRVSLNGKGPYYFILDTGSSVTLVRRELLDQLRIPYREALPVNLATGTSYVERAMVHTVAVAGLSAANIEVVTLESAREGLLKTKVQGILGENFLKHFDILLDKEKHILTLDRTAELADQLAGEHLRLSHEGSFGSVTTPDRMIVNVTVPSSARKPQRFLVDTGTNMAMLFPAKEDAWVYPQTSSQFVMQSYTGILQCRQERTSLRIGTVRSTISYLHPVRE
jgi:predicted aspartyl protease